MLCGSAPIENCIEPDFTVSGSHEWERELRPHERTEDFFITSRFRYQNRPVKDPIAVRGDPEWPLAAYWPVYLSNFMVKDWLNKANKFSLHYWYMQVSDFFAYHGFQTRMIYFHLLDREYVRILKKNFLIEALVYFGSEEEAKGAVATCHRCRYFGHWLNVLPGRTAEYFCNERAIRLVKKSNYVSESMLENTLNPFGKVELAIRHGGGNILVQFQTKDDLLNALKGLLLWKPLTLNEPVRIQRFLESDVKLGIKLAIETQEGFMDQHPRKKILRYFQDGILPIVENTWARFESPKISKNMQIDKKKMNSKLRGKLYRLKKPYKKYMKTEEYKQMSKDEKLALSKEVLENHGFDPFAPKQRKGQPKMMTTKERKASVRHSINCILKDSGKPLITKADQMSNINNVRDKTLQMARDQNKYF